MSRIQNRYASAVHSSSLDSRPETVMSDSDTLGAYGLADRALTTGWKVTGPSGQGYPVKPVPLAVPLERLFAGDNNAAYDIARMLADMAHEHSFKLKIKITQVQARGLAEACLAWHRHGTCKACGGRKWALIPGTVSLSGNPCDVCNGTGKMPFDRQFRQEWRPLAGWLVSELARAAGHAGPAARKSLAEMM